MCRGEYKPFLAPKESRIHLPEWQLDASAIVHHSSPECHPDASSSSSSSFWSCRIVLAVAHSFAAWSASSNNMSTKRSSTVIFDRRILHALSYFEMPRKAARMRHLNLLNEDDSILDAFMALGKLRRPPTLWVPPRPTLRDGCVRFEWHHFRSTPRHALAAFVKPLTAQQQFAMARDRAKRADQRAKREQQQHAAKAIRAEPVAPVQPRTVLTRSGRVVAVLPHNFYAEDGEEDPGASGT